MQAKLVEEEAQRLASFADQRGSKYWKKDISDYANTLEKMEMRGNQKRQA